ncbi:uncharacterized protein F5891DRAFT_1197614 [Suillus fuscotomentosus]|uniref:Uncharacterized protein n=1 Tax=Suillus fuscotomentosus TaxID=1912939 RepID=A0AAD4DRE8_9AGAM|nr:uncharacterized protein F5891DRAFT_1197614 [Suillus fuscotomentosus]KAG1891632.1 hypothetical protein F5891DRAFT_1197614 [Suillus fuscotomentosus]
MPTAALPALPLLRPPHPLSRVTQARCRHHWSNLCAASLVPDQALPYHIDCQLPLTILLSSMLVGAIFALLLPSQTKRCLITSTASFPSPSSTPTAAIACPPFPWTTTTSLQGDSSSLSSSLEQSLRCLPIPSTPLIASPLLMWLIIASPTLSTRLPAACFPYPTGALAGG